MSLPTATVVNRDFFKKTPMSLPVVEAENQWKSLPIWQKKGFCKAFLVKNCLSVARQQVGGVSGRGQLAWVLHQNVG